jgi:hypothetical protein
LAVVDVAQASASYFSYVRATDSSFSYWVQNFKFRALPEFFAGGTPQLHGVTLTQIASSFLCLVRALVVGNNDYKLPSGQAVPYQFVEAGTRTLPPHPMMTFLLTLSRST